MSLSSSLLDLGTHMDDINGGVYPDLQAKFAELQSAIREGPPAPLRKMSTYVIEKDDHVGLSFLLIRGVMLSAAVFFFFQAFLVPRRWINSMIVSGLVTGVAWHHYAFMEEIWNEMRVAPTIYRYMDWLITVPLQVSEFYIILQAASHESRPIPIALFFRLMFAAVFMLVFGYMGETGVMEKMVAFIGGFLMWIWILFEIWFGEAAKSSGMISLEAAKVFLNRVVIRESMRKSNAKVQHNSDSDSDGSQSDKSDSSFSSVTDAENLDVVETNEERLEKMNAKDEAERISGAFKKPEAQMAFELLRYIVTFGWALYPVGYIVGLIDEDLTQDLLNLVYNVADVINKVLYGLAIFYAASADSETDKEIVALSRRPTPDMLLGRKDSMLDLVSKALHQKIAHYDMERVQNSKNRKEGNGSFGNTQSSGPGSSTNESSGISGSQTSDSGMADSVDESSTNNEHDNNTGGDSQSETSNSQPKEKNNEPTTMRLDEAKAETTRTQDHMNDLEDQIRALTAAMDKYPMSSTDHHGVVAANEKPLSRPVTPLHHEKPQFGRD